MRSKGRLLRAKYVEKHKELELTTDEITCVHGIGKILLNIDCQHL